MRGHDLLPAGRLRHAPRCSTSSGPRPRGEVRADPPPRAGQHHRLPELLLALSHRRHRPARAAHPRAGRLARRLSSDRRRHAEQFRPAGGRVQDGRLPARRRRRARHVSSHSAGAKKPWPTTSPGWALAPYQAAVNALGISYQKAVNPLELSVVDRPRRDGRGRQDAGPRRALPRRLPGADQCARVHPPHRPRATPTKPTASTRKTTFFPASWGASARGPAKAAAAISGPTSAGR